MSNHPLASMGQIEQKPRLMISKMELENFKSYAGLQPIGPFHKCFSSVVGPNGSGKSNVIDALLFVFGARAKQLRLNKVSELIHKSALFQSLDYARVSIFFQLIIDDESSDERFEVVPGSEFCISRVAYANNSSKYMIDGRTSTYMEVGTLLKGHGVELDNNRFLILQGEVEQIAMMKPKGQTEHEEGFLEYLEDIIGSNQYVPKIAEATNAVDAINEQRIEKVHRLKVAEKDRDNLHNSKVEAEQLLEKEKTIRQKKNVLYQIYAYISSRNLIEYNKKLEVLKGKLHHERSKLSENEEAMKTVESVYQATKAEHAAMESELQKASTQYDSFERKDVKLQEDLKHCRTTLKKHQTTLSKEEKKVEEALETMKTLQSQITKSESLIDDFAKKKVASEEELNQQMAKVNSSTQHIRAELEEKQRNLAHAEKQAGSLFTDKELVQNSITIIQDRTNKVNQDISAQQVKLESLSAEHEALRNQVKEMTTTQRVVQMEKLSQLERNKIELQQEEQQIKQQVSLLMGSIEENKETLARNKSSASADKTIQAILQASRCGSLVNVKIVGRLGDLACVESKYDVAINTACKFLNYIVVQRTEDAQQIISYLRDNNLGRASFIVLDQMGDFTQRIKTPFTCPSNDVMRLFDLLEDVHSEEVRAAFYMALNNTLVSTDLDNAVAVAYNNRIAYRVVTLQGQLIDTSGAMSGGGQEVKKGLIRLSTVSQKNSKTGASSQSKGSSKNKESSVSEEMIRQQEQQLMSLQSQVDRVTAKISALDVEIKKVSSEVRQIDREIEKMNIAITHRQEKHKEVLGRIATRQTESELTKEEEKELQKLNKELKSLDEQISVCSPNLKMLQMEVNSLQRSILSYGGPEISKLNDKIESYTAQIETLTNNLTTKKVELSSLQKTVGKGDAAVEKIQADMEKTNKKLSALEAEQSEMAADAKGLIHVIDEYKEKLVRLEELLQSKQKNYHEMKSFTAKIKAVEVDLLMEQERLQGEGKEEVANQTLYNKEVQTLHALHLQEQKDLLQAVASAIPKSAEETISVMEVDEDSGLEKLPILAEEELSSLDSDQVKKDINVLEAEKNKLKGNVNMNALIEYLRKDAVYKARLTDLEAITAERSVLLQALEQLKSQRLSAFMQGFTCISLYLKEMYQMLTLGGDAELELIDSLDPFSEGIIFSVRPVKKSWKSILNLSGGEKTLASLALVFALHYFKPTPLYVMDEIDAALDFKNVSIVANYIKERTKNAQFIIISLRNNMFELADRLVGIYKTNDHTKSVTISPKYFTVPDDGKARDKYQPEAKRVPLGDATNRLL